MKKLFKKDKVLSTFFTQLVEEAVSPISIKNYKSDVYSFAHWLLQSIRSTGVFVESFSEALPFFKKSLGLDYRESISSHSSPSSVNRKLSSLRKLSSFMLSSNLVNFDFMEGVSNLDLGKRKTLKSPSRALLSDFEEFLAQEKVSGSTIKNYVSDARHFSEWLDKQGSNISGAAIEDLQTYLQAMAGTFSPSTTKRKEASLKRFLAWANPSEPVAIVIPTQPIPALKEQTPLIKSRPAYVSLNLVLICFLIVSSLLIAIAKFAHRVDAKLAELTLPVAKKDVPAGSVLGVETQGGSAITLSRILDSNFNLSVAGFVEGSTLRSTVTTTAPLSVLSIVKVEKLNADLLDGSDWTALPTNLRTYAPDSLDFTEFEDAMALDASTDIALGGLTFSTSGAGTVNFASTGGVTVSGNLTTSSDLAVNGGDINTSSTTLNITTANTGTVNFRDGSNSLAAVKDEGDYVYLNLKGKSSTSDPSSCSEGDIYYNATDDTIKVCHSGNTWEALDASSGTTAFSNISSGTNTTAAMVVGTGASLSYSGTGTITASDLTCADCLDFTEIADSLTLDAATNIAQAALTLSTSGTGALNFASTGQVTFAGNVDATNGLDVTVANLTVGGANFSVAQASGDITTAGDLAVNGGNITSTGTLDIASTTTNAISLDSGTTGAVNIGTSASAKSVTIGNTTTTTTVNLTKGASGNIVLTGFDCTGDPNGGALTADASGNVSCSVDDGGGAASSVPWSGITDPTTFLTLAFDNGEDNTFSYIHSTGDHSAWTFNYSQIDDLVATDDFDAMTFNLSSESGDAGDTFEGLVINWANGTANTILDAGIRIDNAETTAATLTDAIIITSSGVADGVTDAIDVSASNLNNALNVGANFVLFDGLRAFEGTTGTLTLEDTSGNDMLQVTDQGTTGRLAVSNSLQVGGLTTVAYSRFGTDATGHAFASSNQVLTGDIEVNGILYLDGDSGTNTAGVIHNSNGTLTVKLCSQGGSGPCASTSTLENTLTQGSWLVDNNANVGKAALIVNQQQGGPIFTASAAGTKKFEILNSGNVTIDGSGTMLTVGGGTGKVDVGTVDPVYNIGGTKYATYMAGMIGVKEEVTGNLTTDQYLPGLGYKHTLDFKSLTPGSDLWLWSRATDIKNNIDKVVVLLSPAANTRTWYNIDEGRYVLTVYSLVPTIISYRLTAPRFDYALWTNFSDNPAATGFKVDDEPLTIDPEGEIQGQQESELAALTIEKATDSPTYVVKDALGNIVTEVAKVAEFVAANIRAGAIETKYLATETLRATEAATNRLLVSSGLVSPLIQTEIISPLPGEANVTIKIGGEPQTATESGFGKLLVENSQGDEVASIDTQGNATFAGQLTSSQLAVAGEATIAGTLHADAIRSTTLDDIQKLLSQVEQDQNLLAQSSGWSIQTASQATDFSAENLYVTQQAAINALSISSSLTVGSNLVLQNSGIESLEKPLQLQSLALAPIELMAGKVKIETNGDVTIAGNLFVAGNIESSSLTIKNPEGNLTAAIDASGSAEFASVATDKIVLASATPSATFNGDIETTSSAGQATIPAGAAQITITNPNATSTSLIYATPTSTTQDKVLYVKEKQDGYFRVGFDAPLDAEVTFNWWIVGTSDKVTGL